MPVNCTGSGAWSASMNWRLLVRQERSLLADLVIILVTSLVVGAWFLERTDEFVFKVQRDNMESLAGLTAMNAREYLASDNRVSLNIIARQTASLPTVRRLVIQAASGRELASAGSAVPGRAPVTRALRREDGAPVASVHIWPQPPAGRGRLETGFVLVVLLLLVLRVTGELVYRRLLPQPRASDERGSAGDDGMTPSQGRESQPPAEAAAWMRISIVNFDRMQSRFTATLIDELLADYDRLLRRVASLYGARLEAGLGQRARLVFSGASASEAAFSAVCAGQLFLRAARRLSASRKAAGHTPLEFKLLVAGDADRGRNWSLCVAGVPGRVHVPATQLVQLELDARLLYHSERALRVSAGEEGLLLQPVEQLAQRYQRLVTAQADKLLDEMGAPRASQPDPRD